MLEQLPLLAWPRQQTLTTLIFHRVLPAPDPLRPCEPARDEFDRFMAFVSAHFSVLPLRDAVSRLHQGRLPKRACCITFDDGYADNLTIALPILEKYQLPATVFIATGYLDGGRMFNDTVIDAISRTKRQHLNLEALELGCHSIATLEERKATVDAILERLKYQSLGMRSVQLEKLIELADCGALPADIMLTSQQVGELSRRGVEIGGHTVAHTILTTLGNDAAMREILMGKQQLEVIINKPVTTFAYPNGRPGRDYEARHVAMMREIGFEVVVSTAHGVANRDSDIHQLPRFAPWGNSLIMLAARMMRNAWTGKAAGVC